jgi:hypothetical protein
VHLPAIEGGAETARVEDARPQEEPTAGPGTDEPASEAEAVGTDEADLASFIDGMAVLFSYGWLACGVLLLLAVPVGILLVNRWGRRRRRS